MKTSLATCFAAALLAVTLRADDPTLLDVFRTERLGAMDSVIEEAITESKLVGATLWVERNGVAYHKAYGQRSLTPSREPMTEDTIFDVASITKVVATASAAMLCVERGLLSLDDPVSKHLREFTGEGREKITIRHLLLHSSGLQVNLNGSKTPFSRSREEACAQACREKPLFEPGSSFSYSSVGSMVLGMAVERVTGQKLDAFCTAAIYQPLNMHDTMFRPTGETLRRVAPSSAPERGQVDDFVARNIGGVSGHASLFTTASDLARFARMMLNRGELDGVRVFKPETVTLMTSVQSPPELRSPDAKNLLVRRGLGWDIDTPYRTPPHDYTLSRGALFPIGGYGHTGWTGQMLWIDPFSRTFVIFLCNRYRDPATDTRAAVYQMHHRLSTLAAEAVKDFDFTNVPDALPGHAAAQPTREQPFTNSLGMKFVTVPGTEILMRIHETRRTDYAAYAATNPEQRRAFEIEVMEKVADLQDGAGRDTVIQERITVRAGKLREDYGALTPAATTPERSPLPDDASVFSLQDFATFELSAATGNAAFSRKQSLRWTTQGGQAWLQQRYDLAPFNGGGSKNVSGIQLGVTVR